MGYIFGLDIGVASVGVAVINNQTLEIEEVVSDLFESADASKNVERRSASPRPIGRTATIPSLHVSTAV